MRKVCLTFEFCITFLGTSGNYDETSAKTAQFVIENSLLIIDGITFHEIVGLNRFKVFHEHLNFFRC